jgi:hypothetical protein
MAKLVEGVADVVWSALAEKPARWDRAAYEELWGGPVPADLTLFGPIWEERPGMRFLRHPSRYLKAKNAFEAVVAAAHDEGSTCPLEQVFAHVHALPGVQVTASGEPAIVHVPRQGLCRVGSREDDGEFRTSPWDLATFSWVSETLSALDDETIDADAAIARLAWVKSVWWDGAWLVRDRLMIHDLDVDDVSARIDATPIDLPAVPPPPESRVPALQGRASWLAHLLAGQFSAIHADPAQARHKPGKALAGDLAGDPPEALYWMWRSFFFAEDGALEAVLARVEDSPARLVRDAVALLGEVRRGRRDVGPIADVVALREEWGEVLRSKKAREQRMKADAEAAQREAQERERAAEDEQNTERARRLAKARVVREQATIALVDHGDTAPENGSDRDYLGIDDFRELDVNRTRDWWTRAPSGHVLVIHGGEGQAYVCEKGELHPFSPPVHTTGIAYDFGIDGPYVLAVIDEELRELDLERRTSRKVLSCDDDLEHIVGTPGGFVLDDGERVTVYAYARGGKAEKVRSLPIETSEGIAGLHGGRVLVLIVEKGAIFLALAGEQLHAIGRTSHPVAEVWEHEGIAYCNATDDPYDCEIHNLAEAYAAAVASPAITKLPKWKDLAKISVVS